MDGPQAILLAFLAGIAFAACVWLVGRSILGPRERRPAEPRPAPPRPWDSESRHPVYSIVNGTNVEECLERVTSTIDAESVVVADEEGLLLSTSGDPRYHEPLAVLTGLAAGIYGQVEGALPLKPLRSIELTDQGGATIVCRFFSHGPQRMAVTSLGRTGQRMTPELDRALGGLQAILEQHNAA